jgi:TPR repeat protein
MARIEMPHGEAAYITANANSADVLFELGMMYCSGREVEQDYVSAHKWFNLAALKGNDSAKRLRSEISQEMSPAQIAEAQRQARAWLTLH